MGVNLYKIIFILFKIYSMLEMNNNWFVIYYIKDKWYYEMENLLFNVKFFRFKEFNWRKKVNIEYIFL